MSSDTLLTPEEVEKLTYRDFLLPHEQVDGAHERALGVHLAQLEQPVAVAVALVDAPEHELEHLAQLLVQRLGRVAGPVLLRRPLAGQFAPVARPGRAAAWVKSLVCN